MRFARAMLADVDALHALVNSAYRGESSKRGWTTEADLLGGQRTDPALLSAMIGSPHEQIELLYVDEGGTEVLVGCLLLRWEGEAAYVGLLTVDPARQTGGLGSALLAHAEELARARRCPRVRMTVIPRRTELIAYYGRRGYRATGKTERFPVDDPRYGLPKVDDLSFIELEKIL